MDEMDDFRVLQATSTEVKNRYLTPGEILYAIDTGTYYVGGKDGKPQALVSSSTSSDGGNVFPAGMRGFSASGLDYPTILSAPSWFDVTPPFPITRIAGIVKHGYDREAWKTPGTAVLWVSATRGNDTTGDGSYAAPYMSWLKVMSMVAAHGTTIYAEAGVWDRRYCMGLATMPDYDINVIAVGGTAVSSTRYEKSGAANYALQGDGTYTPTSARSATVGAIDKKFRDARGVPSRLKLVASQAECAATPGSMYIGASTFYVRLADDRAPDTDLVVFLGSYNGNIKLGRKYYFQGIEFEGGNDAFYNTNTVTAGSRLVFDSCGFIHSMGNGLTVYGVPTVLSINCYSYNNRQDGFNYHQGTVNLLPVFAIEIDCQSYSNGEADGSNNDNGSTLHENCRAIRIRTMAGNNIGPTFADVGTSKSWNIDCVDFGSAAPASATNQNVGFGAYDTAMMALDGCCSANSPVQAYKQASATMVIAGGNVVR